MDIRDHYALSTGTAPLADGRRVQLTVLDLGDLQVESGLLGACDPFASLYNPVVLPIAPGRYPVRVTIADVSAAQNGSHLREAYLSVVLSNAESTSIDAASKVDGPPGEGLFWIVPVDAGTVAFVDADAVGRCMPGEGSDWYSELFDTGEPDGWFAQMDNDSPYPPGTANIVLPLATRGENVVLSHSGWGDGFYPLMRTTAEDGTVTGIHIDLLVVGASDEAPPATDEITPPSSPEPSSFKERLARLFRR